MTTQQRPGNAADTGARLKLHRRRMRLDGREYTVLGLRPGSPARFATNLHQRVLAYAVRPAQRTTDDERRLLAVDPCTDPGRTFRLPVRWYADVSANLCIANMDFDEFADATDESGTYRSRPR